MSEYLKKTAMFVRDLLGVDEQTIRIGRLNYDLPDAVTPFIGVDSLGGAVRKAKGEKYDGEAEVMTYAARWQSPVTVTFYNTDAHRRAGEFALLVGSQKSLELQEALGLSVYQSSALTDVKLLTGSTYNERVEVLFNVGYSLSADVDTLRIDTAQTEFLLDK